MRVELRTDTTLDQCVPGQERVYKMRECSTFVLFCFVLFCFVLFCFVLFCFVLFCFVLFCFVLFCFVLFCFVLFCFVLFCFVLFCFVLFCFVLFCFVQCAGVWLCGCVVGWLVFWTRPYGSGVHVRRHVRWEVSVHSDTELTGT